MRNGKAEQKWIRRLASAGEVLDALDEGFGAKSLEKARVRSINILLAGPDRGDVLFVIKVASGGEDYVGFVGGPDVVTALLTWRAKETGAGVRYREDVPWGER